MIIIDSFPQQYKTVLFSVLFFVFFIYILGCLLNLPSVGTYQKLCLCFIRPKEKQKTYN